MYFATKRNAPLLLAFVLMDSGVPNLILVVSALEFMPILVDSFASTITLFASNCHYNTKKMAGFRSLYLLFSTCIL